MIKLKRLLMKRGLKLVAAIFLASLTAITLTTCGGRGEVVHQMVAVHQEAAAEVTILNVDKFGEGVIVSDKSGVNCGNDCSETYSAGTSIILTATAGNGYQFNS